MVKVPKVRNTYCPGKKCMKHTPHKVTQYKAGKASLYAQGKRRYDRKQAGFGGQTKPVFHKSAWRALFGGGERARSGRRAGILLFLPFFFPHFLRARG